MAIQGSPVKSRYHRYQADTSMPVISTGVNHLNIYLSQCTRRKPKGEQDTWVLVTHCKIHKYPSLKTSIKTAANKINNATFFQSFQRLGCPWSTLTSVLSVLTPLTAPFGSGSTKPGERAFVSCRIRAIWKCSPAEVISTCTILPMRSPSLLWIRT